MKLLKIFLIAVAFVQIESITLDCEYNQFDGWNSLGPTYECKATVNLLVDNSDQSKVASISQNHLDGKTNSDVEAFSIMDQNLQTFPKEIENFFPNLKGIFAYDCKIKVITKDSLQFPNLQWIRIASNELMSLDDDLFNSTPNLQLVSFMNNKIKHVGRNTFQPLENLEFLQFYGESNCINETAQTRDEVVNLISKLPVVCSTTIEI